MGRAVNAPPRSRVKVNEMNDEKKRPSATTRPWPGLGLTLLVLLCSLPRPLAAASTRLAWLKKVSDGLDKGNQVPMSQRPLADRTHRWLN